MTENPTRDDEAAKPEVISPADAEIDLCSVEVGKVIGLAEMKFATSLNATVAAKET